MTTTRTNDPYSQYIDMDEYNGTNSASVNTGVPIGAQGNRAVRDDKMAALQSIIGANRSPIDAFKDVGVGLMRGGQHLAETLGEAGQGIASAATGGYAPRVNMREEMGLGKENPVDFQNLIGSKNPSALLQGVAQYAPGALMGGSNLAGQVASNAMWGASQALPDTKAAIPLLPPGRASAALEGGVMGALPFGVAKGMQAGKSALDYMRPQNDAASFMQNLGGGSQTAEENLNQLSQRIQYAHDTNKAEALNTKQGVIDAVGDKRIDQLPGFDPKKVAKIFATDSSDLTDENMKSLSSALNGYYKNQNLDKFVEKGENIFGHEGLTPGQISKVDDLLEMKQSDYLSKGKAADLYDNDLMGLHDKFSKNPTFNNADKLRSQIGDEMSIYQRQADQNKLQPADYPKLKSLKNSYDLITKDQDNFLNGVSPELQDQYKLFKNQWRENVIPYRSSQTLKTITSKGSDSGITPGAIGKEFSFPDSYTKKIAEDIGPSGRNQILYNAMQSSAPSGDAGALAKALQNAKLNKGYQTYMTPEIDQAGEQFGKRANLNKYYESSKAAMKGAGLGLIMGHPLMGGIAGVAAKEGLPLLAKYLAKGAKK